MPRPGRAGVSKPPRSSSERANTRAADLKDAVHGDAEAVQAREVDRPKVVGKVDVVEGRLEREPDLDVGRRQQRGPPDLGVVQVG